MSVDGRLVFWGIYLNLKRYENKKIKKRIRKLTKTGITEMVMMIRFVLLLLWFHLRIRWDLVI